MDNNSKLLALARRSLAAFAPWCSPGYQVYRHHSILIKKLEDVEAGRIKRLMIFAPPRHGKSLTTSEIFPTWFLGRNPKKSVILASYNQDFASGLGRRIRNHIANPNTQAIFPDLKLADDSAAAMRFDTTSGNSFYAVGRGGSITGRGAHLLLIDDPIKDSGEARSETIRRQLHEWYSSVLYTRRQPDSPIILIQTRWHFDDLGGWLLKEHAAENWDVLSMPAIAETDEKWRKEGESLWSERFPLEELEATKRVLGSYGWASLYQQRPVPEEGAVFKTEWFQRYDELPARFSKIVLSLDTAYKTGKENDYSCATVWGVADNRIYLLHCWKARVEFPQLKRHVALLASEWKPNAILIEDKASGQSLLQELRQATRFPVLAIKVDADKVTRAHACAPMIEAGRIAIPQSAPWLADYLDEMSTFPAGAHDDSVDSTTQALNWLRTRNFEFGLLKFYENLAIEATKRPMVAPQRLLQAPEASPAPVAAEEPRCAQCEGTFIQKVPSGFRCGQCAFQWGAKPSPTLPGQTRTSVSVF